MDLLWLADEHPQPGSRTLLRTETASPSTGGIKGVGYCSGIMNVVVGSFTLSMMLVAAADVGGQVCGQERRSHFGLRVVLSLLAAPAVLLLVTGGVALGVLPGQTNIVVFVLMISGSPALLLVPSLLYRTSDSSPGDAGPGGGSGRGQPPSPSDRPSGDLPLPDAEPGRWRARDHRPDRAHARPRRPAREPEPRPAPASRGIRE
jgi:hypothetical protein